MVAHTAPLETPEWRRLWAAATAVDMHDGSVDTVDWPLQLCMNLAVVAAAAAAAAGNTILIDVENGCFVVRGHASF